jgi:predicted Zn-dependent protease
MVAFVRHGEQVYRLIGFSREAQWPDYSHSVEASLGSFQRLTDPAILAIQPARVDVMKVSVYMSLPRFNTKYPSSAPLDTVALLNRLQVDDQLVAGTRIKRIVGGRPSGS